ncbi:N-acetyltransferase [filamentous cyanobacterium LEGE 11480]|uniref:N-acetyltransferase n=1 Tax=Romeriopsis navalis LEGE 11480 TaxID=2777977 RepID=A0A928Z175_9CYAN|nr:GNAT family N-acetyltransferase [Romeriopsis navalis]MBE9028219.1 N-acetyltransferase [Romeriopsis navalis LEGE 11480]
MPTDPSPMIRTAVAEDYAAIANIYNQAIAQGGMTFDDRDFGTADIQAWVDHFGPRERLLVITDAQRILGWGIIKRYSDRVGYRLCCETSIYLDQAEIGQGYGKLLMQVLIQTVQDFGYHHIVAKILANNQGSIQFHQRFGFELVGIQKDIGYLRGEWYDIAILQWIAPSNRNSD